MKDQAKRILPSQEKPPQKLTKWEVGYVLKAFEMQTGALKTVPTGAPKEPPPLCAGGQGRADYNPAPSHRNALARLLTSVAWTVTGLAVCGVFAWIGYRLGVDTISPRGVLLRGSRTPPAFLRRRRGFLRQRGGSR